MRLRPKILSLFLRSFAAATLVLWIGAQVACQTHCIFDGFHDGDDDNCHDAINSASPHSDDEHGSQPCDSDHCADASCQALKSALIGDGASPLVAPQFSFLYAVSPFMLMLDATEIEPIAFFSRQAKPPKWVFTPEVCLGPAFRSHAPPFSSLT